MWTKLSADKKSELMKAYKKGGFSYRDMIDDYNTSYEKFDLGGETGDPTKSSVATLPNNDYININTSYESKDPKDWTINDYKQYDFNRSYGLKESKDEFNDIYKKRLNQYSGLGNYDNINSARSKDRIYNMYIDQVDYNGDPIDKNNLLYSKKHKPEDFDKAYLNYVSNYPGRNSSDDNKFFKETGKTKEEIENYYTNDLTKNSYINYLNSPQYQSIAKNFYGDDYKNQVQNQIDKINLATIKYGETNGAVGTSNNNDILMKPTGRLIPNNYTKQIIDHELSHQTDQGLKGIYYNVDDRGKNVNNVLENKWLDFMKNNLTQGVENTNKDERNSYFANPTESRARVNSIRKWMIENNIDLNSNDIKEKIKGNSALENQYWELQQIMNDDSIKKAIQEMAINNNNNQLPIAKMGGMIKRADGSYSKRGLWDNIRANAGSGKAPTKEMLRQERRIKNKYEEGGIMQFGNGGNQLPTNGLNVHKGIPSEQNEDNSPLWWKGSRYPSRIQDEAKRDEAIKNYYWNVRDEGASPNDALRTLKENNQSYGSDRFTGTRPDYFENYHGFDYNDINDNKIKQFELEYNKHQYGGIQKSKLNKRKINK